MAEGRLGALIGLALVLAGCTKPPPPQSKPAADAPASLKIAPRPAPPPASASAVAVEIRGDVVTVAGEAVPGDLLSLRGALARHRGGATTVEVLLVDPKPELVEELALGAASTELKSLVLTHDGRSVEVWLAEPELASHEVKTSDDGRLHLRSTRQTPEGDDLATWLPGQPSEEAVARDKLREACAQSCLVRVSRAGKSAARPLWDFLTSWQELARGMPQVKVSLAYRVVKGKTTVSGRLPPEVIQRVVRENFEIFRKCYEQGLARDAKLEGRVTVRFVIGREGKVTGTADGGSDIADVAVRDCVIDSFTKLEFPAPEGGIVTVVYPILFAPG